MSRLVRFSVLLVVGLALLTAVAFWAVSGAVRGWIERDLEMRATLAVSAARQALAERWSAGGPAIASILRDVADHPRVVGAIACDPAGTRLASSGALPRGVDCSMFVAAARDGRSWSAAVPLRDGDVHVTVQPIVRDDTVLGAVAVVHDLGFLEPLLVRARWWVVGAFALFAAVASILTITAERLSWREWTGELTRTLRGGRIRPEFAPLVDDVRDLVRRVTEEQSEPGGGWTPERLKTTLNRHLHGERVVIVANREPYIHHRRPDGTVAVQHPASGLVTALEPVMRACSGVWIAHGSGSADRDTADAQGRLRVPPGEDAYSLRRVWLTREEERGYYYGFANEGLWPLCHVAHTRPLFRSADWEHYRIVNERFSDAVVDETDTTDPVVLVQDYHFALMPGLVRRRLPRATVLSFWHIPWPNAERVAICPWRVEVLRGMLGSSILGFHTQLHCNNFLDTVDRYLEARIDREQNAVSHEGHTTLIRPYPISIEWPSHWAGASPATAVCRARVWAELRLPADGYLGLGVDRLDYTKGIEERLLAVERLLERYPSFVGKFTFVQLAAPSRSSIEEYRQVDVRVTAIAERVNERFARGEWRPIVLKRLHHEPQDVFRYYRAADVCYVSSLHDGMNLVAKEFVAARDDEQGVLVLSTFTGAARELTESLLVNPYDLDEASDAIAYALTMPEDEQRDRLRAMRSYLSHFNVYRWAGRMLLDAARLRQRGELSGRFAGVRRLYGREPAGALRTR